MSSHREAPAISKDPAADSTDVYAFVSPDAPTPSRSSPTTCRCRSPTAGRTSSSSAPRRSSATQPRSVTMCSTRSTSTTPEPASLPSPTSSSSPRRSSIPTRSSTPPGRSRTRLDGVQHHLEPSSDLHASPGSTPISPRVNSTSHPHQPAAGSGGASPALPAMSAFAPRRTTQTLSAPAVYRMSDGRDGLRRPAGRRLLRRPRLHLRPGRPAADLERPV